MIENTESGGGADFNLYSSAEREEYTWLSRLRSDLEIEKDIDVLSRAYRGKEKNPLYEAVMENNHSNSGEDLIMLVKEISGLADVSFISTKKQKLIHLGYQLRET